MKHTLYNMFIEEMIGDGYLIKLYDETDNCYVLFDPKEKSLVFLEDEGFIQVFIKNEYQLRKMLHNKRKDTYYVGFKLKFVFTEGKDIGAYNDRSNILVLDKRTSETKNYVINSSDAEIDLLYTDASFLEGSNKGGIAVIHVDLEGDHHLYHERVEGASSNLMELLAAIRGLEILYDKTCIRIITDSQYVRKGLTEWIIYWELNDWTTVNGEPVKNKLEWQKFNELSKGKYLEFQWVKAHRNHFENTLCDLYARDNMKDQKK